MSEEKETEETEQEDSLSVSEDDDLLGAPRPGGGGSFAAPA